MTQIKCGLYARYSSDNQREKSIEDQIRKCRELARSKGWIILEEHIYFDKAISGTSIAPRKSLNSLLEIVKTGKAPFTYIIVDDTSRLSRDTYDALKIFHDLSYMNVYVYYVSQGIDTAQETAEDIITIQSLANKIQIKNISHETFRGIEGQVEKGFSGGGKRYGYKSEPVYTGKKDRYGNPEPDGYKLIINPEEAEVIIRIFRLFAEDNYSAKKIANILNKELIETGKPKPPRGKYWSVSTILGSKNLNRGILNNEIYRGKYIWNKTTSKKNPHTGRKKSITNNPKEWLCIDIADLRIITDELWEKVKSRQKEVCERVDGQYTKARPLYSENLLTGIAKCGICGKTFGITSGGKYKKYGCSTNWNMGNNACSNSVKVKRELLEESVILCLSKELSNKDSTFKVLNEIYHNFNLFFEQSFKNLQVVKIQELHDELRLIEIEIENIISAIKFGIFTETTKRALSNNEKRKRELENQIILSAIDHKLDITHLISHEDLKSYFSTVVEGLIDPNFTRETLYSIVEKIIIKCESDGAINVDIYENTDKTNSYLLNLLNKRDTRIRLQSGTGFIPYTSRIFKVRIQSALDVTRSNFDGQIVLM